MPSPIQITPLDPRTCMRVRSWLPADFPQSIGNTALPTRVGTVVPGLASVLCLGPGEWLVTSAARSIRHLMNHIAGDLPEGLVLVDLSDGLSGLEIRGAAARELLSKGCGLDFHASVFPAATCARTRFAHIPIVLECHREDGFLLYVARSYFDYLHSWLLDAVIEFQTVVPPAIANES